MIIELCAHSGMRIGEVLQLRKEQVFLGQNGGAGRITIRSKKQSRSKKVTVRYFPVPPKTKEKLRIWMKATKGQHLFEGRHSRKGTLKILYNNIDRIVGDTRYVGLRPH